MGFSIMSKVVLVTGANGQLGKSIAEHVADVSQYQFVFLGRDDLDLETPESIENYLNTNEFEMVVNCAAYTAVDKAESEPEIADRVNHLAVKKIAEVCKRKNSALIHISTDYVFNGRNFKPYTETDATDPQSVYGKTKLLGEQAICEINPKGIVIRTSWVYSEYGNNFAKTMLRLGKERDQLGVIFDQIGTPTYAGDLALAIVDILEAGKLEDRETSTNIYHFSNEGVASWYDFAEAIFDLSGIDCVVTPIETKDYPTPATRPKYSLLNKSKFKQTFDLEIPYWRDSLKKCLSGI